jgi:hypothetical protein
MAALLLGLIVVVGGHYVNVIDETGLEGRDEMPAVMRDVSFGEDMFFPFLKLIAATVLCLGPAIALFAMGEFAVLSPWAALAGAAGIAGIVLFPAVLLTLACSPTVMNLTPVRLLRTIVYCGPWYWAAVPVPLIAVALHVIAVAFSVELFYQTLGETWLGAYMVGPGGVAAQQTWWWVGPLLILCVLLAVYLAHGFAWLLGRLFRRHHEQFGWVLMRHEPRVRPSVATPTPA